MDRFRLVNGMLPEGGGLERGINAVQHADIVVHAKQTCRLCVQFDKQRTDWLLTVVNEIRMECLNALFHRVQLSRRRFNKQSGLVNPLHRLNSTRERVLRVLAFLVEGVKHALTGYGDCV